VESNFRVAQSHPSGLSSRLGESKYKRLNTEFTEIKDEGTAVRCISPQGAIECFVLVAALLDSRGEG
jgi:hypothetical protein